MHGRRGLTVVASEVSKILPLEVRLKKKFLIRGLGSQKVSHKVSRSALVI